MNRNLVFRWKHEMKRSLETAFEVTANGVERRTVMAFAVKTRVVCEGRRKGGARHCPEFGETQTPRDHNRDDAEVEQTAEMEG
jgi:hypothetical protein